MKPIFISMGLNLVLLCAVVGMAIEWPKPVSYVGNQIAKMRRDSPYISNYGIPVCPPERTCMVSDAVVMGNGQILGYHDGYKWYDYNGAEIK